MTHTYDVEITVPVFAQASMTFRMGRADWERMGDDEKRAHILAHLTDCQSCIDRAGDITPGAVASMYLSADSFDFTGLVEYVE